MKKRGRAFDDYADDAFEANMAMEEQFWLGREAVTLRGKIMTVVTSSVKKLMKKTNYNSMV